MTAKIENSCVAKKKGMRFLEFISGIPSMYFFYDGVHNLIISLLENDCIHNLNTENQVVMHLDI